MSSSIGVGNEVPLVLDVGDANDTLYVRATVFQPNQTIINTFNLLAKGDGRYAHSGFNMPDFDYITAKFVVYADNGYSIRAGYYDVTESFSKNEASSGGDNSDLIDTINRALDNLRTVNIEIDVVEEEEVIIGVDDTPDEIVLDITEEENDTIIELDDLNDEIILDVDDDPEVAIEVVVDTGKSIPSGENIITSISLSAPTTILSELASIGDEIGVLSSVGGYDTLYTINGDPADKFQIVGKSLQYKNKVLFADSPLSVVVRATSSSGHFLDETFDFTVALPTYQTTKSILFNGTNELFKAPDTDDHNLAFVDAITLFARVKIDVLATNARGIQTFTLQNGTLGPFYSYFELNGNFTTVFKTPSGNKVVSISAVNVPVDTWLTLVVKASLTTTDVWVNGFKLISSSGLPDNLIPCTHGEGLSIGAMRSTFWRWDGLMNEVAAYNVALTDLQIEEMSVPQSDLTILDSIDDAVYIYRLGETLVDAGGGIFKVVDEVNGHDATSSSIDLSNIVEDVPE